MSERLLVIPVPRNLSAEFVIGGVPLRDFVTFGMVPVGLGSIIRVLGIDIGVPFPGFRWIYLSNFILWVLAPIGFVILKRWRKRNPDVELMDAVKQATTSARLSGSARDPETVPYLVEPPLALAMREPARGEWQRPGSEAVT